jgi:pilus assembly protein CpaF
MYGELCSVKEITDGVRAVINSRQQQLSDAEVLALIEDYVLGDRRTEGCSFRTKGELITGIFNATRKDLDILQPYADDVEVSEIMVNGIDHIFIERKGRIEKRISGLNRWKIWRRSSGESPLRSIGRSMN